METSTDFIPDTTITRIAKIADDLTLSYRNWSAGIGSTHDQQIARQAYCDGMQDMIAALSRHGWSITR